ncbi:MAG: hypothetical protein ACQEW9_18435 [Bacteroidota bacterium]
MKTNRNIHGYKNSDSGQDWSFTYPDIYQKIGERRKLITVAPKTTTKVGSIRYGSFL